MGDAVEDRAKAARLPEGDVIRVLLEQHAQIRDLFAKVKSATGQARQESFDALRALLAVHETAEELVLRPVTVKVAGQAVADARNEEEKEANAVLAELEKLDVNDADFGVRFEAFEKSVDEHAEAEENEEFKQITSSCDADERRKMGSRIKAAEAIAPTHPHPAAAGSTTAQMVLGPFASMVDRVKDAIAKTG